MSYFVFFVAGLWVSDAANEWKRGEPWEASAVWALLTLAAAAVLLIVPGPKL